jgi:tetratricopeptide (TPR) repeat protein
VLEWIENALEKEPGDFYVHIWRAKVVLSLGRSCDEAMADMEKAAGLTMQLNSTMKYWLSWHEVTYVANMCPDQMRIEEALQMAQEIQQRDPNSSSTNGVCGLALYRAGRPAEAIQMLERCMEVSSKPAATMIFSLSMAYKALGRDAQARETFQQGLLRMHETYPEATLIKLMRDEAAKKVGVEL